MWALGANGVSSATDYREGKEVALSMRRTFLLLMVALLVAIMQLTGTLTIAVAL